MKTPKRIGSVLHLLGNGLLLSAASLGLLHTFLSLYPVIWTLFSRWVPLAHLRYERMPRRCTAPVFTIARAVSSWRC